MNKQFNPVLLSFLSISCTVDLSNSTDSEETPICGNLIEEIGEECDSDFYECSHCKNPRIIFINSFIMLSPSEIGDKSLEELDESCEKEALKNDLTGINKWKAWISKKDFSIKDRVYKSPGLYINYNRDILSYSFMDFTDGTINKPILYDQTGKQFDVDVWTGTLSDGTYSDTNCKNWTLNEGFFGTIGNTNTILKDWTNINEYADCSMRRYFYCIESENI